MQVGYSFKFNIKNRSLYPGENHHVISRYVHKYLLPLEATRQGTVPRMRLLQGLLHLPFITGAGGTELIVNVLKFKLNVEEAS